MSDDQANRPDDADQPAAGAEDSTAQELGPDETRPEDTPADATETEDQEATADFPRTDQRASADDISRREPDQAPDDAESESKEPAHAAALDETPGRWLTDPVEDAPPLATVLPAAPMFEDEGTGDTDSIVETPEDALELADVGVKLDWDSQTSSRKIAVELKHIEQEVRTILDSLDTRRKRRLTGSRRWLDLQEDIISWHFGGKFDRATLELLQRLVTRRHYLFRRLKFLAGTRPTWNT